MLYRVFLNFVLIAIIAFVGFIVHNYDYGRVSDCNKQTDPIGCTIQRTVVGAY